MENYEINILRRNGNWKKVKQDDLVMSDDNENNKTEQKQEEFENLDDDFRFYLNQVNSIINKLENLEKEKNNLKNQLKIYEQEFISKKTDTQNKIDQMTHEREIIDKTINIIKSLKSF